MGRISIKLCLAVPVAIFTYSLGVQSQTFGPPQGEAAFKEMGVMEEVTGQVFSELGEDVTKEATVLVGTSAGEEISARIVKAKSQGEEGEDVWIYRLRDVPEGETRFRVRVAHRGAVEEIKTLKREDAGTPLRHNLRESASGWWAWLLLIPGVLSLGYVCWRERSEAKPSSGQTLKSRFDVAAVNAAFWVFVLAIWLGFLGSQGITQISLFEGRLSFRFYVPIFGFIGAMLYVLDLFRGREDVSVGKEFGMRVVMGPYVAIVMVVLFAQDFQFLQLHSPIAQGIIAFFSGLLVVVAFQGLTERGNEVLGRWREKFRYKPSEIGKEFDLTKEDDLTLQKAGLRYLNQLRETPDGELKQIARAIKFDESLALSLKTEAEKSRLRRAIGKVVWERLKKKSIETLEEFVQLDDAVLQEVAQQDPPSNLEHLKTIRDKGRAFVLAQI